MRQLSVGLVELGSQVVAVGSDLRNAFVSNLERDIYTGSRHLHGHVVLLTFRALMIHMYTGVTVHMYIK